MFMVEFAAGEFARLRPLVQLSITRACRSSHHGDRHFIARHATTPWINERLELQPLLISPATTTLKNSTIAMSNGKAGHHPRQSCKAPDVSKFLYWPCRSNCADGELR